ncbi:MAG: hypothetical protein LBG84_06730 [Treponema sp.]|jgi:hypothetical protein|nr:hypothetical protein [Treponema sp.]
MKRRGWIAAAVLVCAGLVVTAPARAQDKISLDELARYLGVEVKAKIVEKAVNSLKDGAASAAYKKKDYAGVVRALEARLDRRVESLRRQGVPDVWIEQSLVMDGYSPQMVAAWKAGKAKQAAAEDKAEAERKAAEEQAAIAAANAAGAQPGDFKAELTKDSKGAKITAYTGRATIVTIPAVLEGFPVTELTFNGNIDRDWRNGDHYKNDSSFAGFTNVTTVNIGPNVTKLNIAFPRGKLSLATQAKPQQLGVTLY